ncbi:MAG: hypothetical protein R8P61_09005 [Bacteroidia bacterium]|nr:hypothetical protein [Bacteroidia bacterium]
MLLFRIKWLESFEYEYLISGWELALVASAAFLIVMLGFRFHPFKASLFNPLERLKTD